MKPFFTFADAFRALAIARCPITSQDIANDTLAAQEHWQAIGALRVIMQDLAAADSSGADARLQESPE